MSSALTSKARLEDVLSVSLSEYWGLLYARKRGTASLPATTYRGARMLKIPNDLATYEQIIWDVRPDLIVEIGTLDGGSALWLHDRLALLHCKGLVEQFNVVTIDLDASPDARELGQRYPDVEGNLHLLQGDARDPVIISRVQEFRATAERCLVIEDSYHDYETTIGALRAYADLVSVGSYYVVEDGTVDIPELRDAVDEVRAMRGQQPWPTGVRRAIEDWLSERPDFEMDREREAIVTTIPWGYLRRVAA